MSRPRRAVRERAFPVVAFAALVCASPAHALLAWRAELPSNEHGHGAPARGVGLRLEDGEAARVEYWKPDLTRAELKPKGEGMYAAPQTGFDNYHLLLAKRERQGMIELALRYVPRNGRPSGHSPRELLSASKGVLEIVPDPLPREHRRWVSGERVEFLVRYDGVPLVGARVRIETSHHSQGWLATDLAGGVSLRIPDDYPEVRPGRSANPPADLMLAVEHESGGRRHATTLSHDYHADPDRWQSRGDGLAVAGFGFIAGLGLTRLLRRRRNA